jgi:integrase/recombinase XerD
MEDDIKSVEVEVLNPKYLTKDCRSVKKEEQIDYFTKEEILDRLKECPPNEHGILFQFLWRTGVRVTEAISIKKKDLDFMNQEITIRWLKNRKFETRVIPMHPSLRLILYTFTAKLNNEDRMFKFTRQYVDQLCKKYKFEHAHKLRHSFAVHFLRQSDNPAAFTILQHLLGHSDIRTTMEYLKVVPMEQKKALEKISFD